MELLVEERAFARWLRTGHLPTVRSIDGVELKFNPHHDPRDGRFISGPGGVSNGSDKATEAGDSKVTDEGQRVEPERGSNSRAFEDPMTLEQAFPGLSGSPAGAVFALANNMLDITGPATEMRMDFLQHQSNQFSAQIKAIDPAWHYDEIVPTDARFRPTPTVEGLAAKVNDLRFQRAAAIARVNGNYEPLQVETLRFVQEQTDAAYQQGRVLLTAGKLTRRLSDPEALGNYIDRTVRLELRERYSRLGIDSAGAGPVRVIDGRTTRQEANSPTAAQMRE